MDAYETRRIEFPNDEGELLAARLEVPTDAARAYAVFAHCFTCSKDVFAASRVSRGLTAHGIAVLRFDFTGIGGSEGDFANTNFSSNVEDLVSAARWLEEEHRPPSLLIGHSLGGAAVLVAAASLPSVRAVATIAAPSDPRHVAELLGPVAERIEEKGLAAVSLGGRTFRIRKQFLDDLQDQRLERDLAHGPSRALVIFHSPADEVVPIEHARRLFDAARHPKSFVSLDDADHLLSREEDSRYVAEVLAAWSRRYL